MSAAGIVGSYIHFNNKVGVLVDVRCETDFVGRTEEFQTFTKEIALQIAAMSPKYISRKDIPVKEETEELWRRKDHGINMEDWYKEVCLLEQNHIKSNKTIGELLEELKSKVKEECYINRFIRYEI